MPKTVAVGRNKKGKALGEKTKKAREARTNFSGNKTGKLV